ncbi:MAG: glycosyltransferase family 9 protein [Gammaproteobacteria bacterium]|nr:glycosyltransferase family 9 protein [Gammaproteobacteria bacterium]
MKLPLATPPASICLLRLSAVGDVVHAVPIVRTVQQFWPATAITWIIGQPGIKLVGDMDGVEFITYDKAAGSKSRRDVRRRLAGRQFDVLIHTQASLRANLVSAFVRADVRLGYDRARGRDLQGLFINQRLPPDPRQHVVDSFFDFLKVLGLPERVVRWDIPIAPADRGFAESHLPGTQPTMIISPSSTRAARAWSAQRYATVADYAIEKLGIRIALCGGRTAAEREFGAAITSHMRNTARNLIGKDTLKQFLSLLERADVLLSPDSGPVHMATSVGTPVIGLYAASNLQRTGPYLNSEWCIDRYDAAARRYQNRPARELRWGKRLEYPGVMDLVTVDDVTAMLERFCHAGRASCHATFTDDDMAAGTEVDDA